MLFNSFFFLVFFALVFILYFALPKKHRYIVLLLGSYYFYATWGVPYVMVLLGCTATSYLAGRLLTRQKSKVILIGSLVLELGILAFFKYTNFFISNINLLIPTSQQIDTLSIVMPIGISFYVFQSTGYVIDIYRGKRAAQTNFAKYALFVSFFPTVMSGPIERSDNLLVQIENGTDFSYDNAKTGILYMLLGYAEKLLIANRLSSMVSYAFSNYTTLSGLSVLWAVILYGIQIYADFAGYSLIAIGMARTLGFQLRDNFKQPYFAVSIKDFWKRWHMSLSSWLKDYVYISLGGNRCGTFRKYLNLLITFLISGIWHGANWTFIVWGLIHGVYQIVGGITQNLRNKITRRLRINTATFSHRLLQMLITFILVDFAWIFFQASDLTQAFGVISKICFGGIGLSATFLDKMYLLGLDFGQFTILMIEILLMIVVDVLHENNYSITAALNRQSIVFRWICYGALIVLLLLGIIRDYGGSASSFIYAQF